MFLLKGSHLENWVALSSKDRIVYGWKLWPIAAFMHETIGPIMGWLDAPSL